MDEHSKLRFARETFTKTMLGWVKIVVSVKEVHNLGENDVLHYLAGYAG